MKPTWVLSAAPVPTTAFFTARVAYSATVSPACAGAMREAARAWPSFSVEAGLTLTNTSSTATSSGWWAAITSTMRSNRKSSLWANSPSTSGRITRALDRNHAPTGALQTRVQSQYAEAIRVLHVFCKFDPLGASGKGPIRLGKREDWRPAPSPSARSRSTSGRCLFSRG